MKLCCLSVLAALVLNGCGIYDLLDKEINQAVIEKDCEKDPKTCDNDGDGPTEAGGDCDDTDDTIYPTAEEIWGDGIDQNCDGNDSDSDWDGYAARASGGDDCDDGDPTIYPGADEVCDGIDNDCDGYADDDDNDVVITTTSLWYPDEDGDGYGGNTTAEYACDAPTGYLADNTDCDDGDTAIYPGADEIICDGIDNDCDEHTVDEPTRVWYADEDEDGYGDGSNYVTESRCETPAGYVDNADDCDDSDAAVNPGTDEVCDGFDNDCDGDVDEEVCAGE